MEETIPLIIQGCQLAKVLESNLPNLANQPDVLSKSCDDIIKLFTNAKERLNHPDPITSYPPAHMLLFREAQESSQTHTGIQDWLRSSYTQLLADKGAFGMQAGLPAESRAGVELGARDREGSSRSRGSGGEFQGAAASDSARCSSSQRPRRRRDDAEKRVVRVAAPRIGNTEIPPEDGFTWRKYGQKEILGSRYPRGYYRCTHQKLYECPAKKQVQRLDYDPFTFEVTYRGNHICHMSSTAPSVAPLSVEMDQDQMNQTATTQPPLTTTSGPLSTWLSMEIRPTGEGTSSLIMDSSREQMYRSLRLIGAGGSSSSMVGSDGAGPSTVPYGREADYHPVVDMADVMFNSGSSSTNSMDFIFPSMEDKWEPDDKKN